MEKICKKCGASKNIIDFYLTSDKKNHRSTCKVCIINNHAEVKRNKRKKRDCSDMAGEEWKWINGYEEYYMVSNLGRIKSMERWIIGNDGFKRLISEKVRKIYISKTGYCKLSLYKEGSYKTILVHKVELDAFIKGENESLVTNHKNAIRSDNNLSNIEKCTSQYNNEYKYKVIGYKFPKGENNKKSKKIIVIHPDGKTESITGILEASRRLGFPKTCIRRVLCNEKESYRNYKFVFDEPRKVA